MVKTSIAEASSRRHALTPNPISRSAGFTLIELLVVMAIIALLLTISTPRFFNHVDRSREVILRDNLKVTREIIDRFYSDLGRYPGSLQELVEKRYLRAIPVDPITESPDTWLFEQPPDGKDGKVFDIHSGAAGNGFNGKPYGQW